MALASFRRPVPVEHELQRWLEFVSAAGRQAVEWITKGVRYHRGADGHWFKWREEVREVPDEIEVARALQRNDLLDKKRNAAPSFDDLAHEFGAQGLVYGPDGTTIVGYKYPEQVDPEKRLKQNLKVYEMWNPQRKVMLEQSGIVSAETPMTTLLDKDTGRTQHVVQRDAERVAKKNGMVEKRARGRRKKVI